MIAAIAAGLLPCVSLQADGLEDVFLLTEGDISNRDGDLSEQFITNFQFTSILLSRKVYGASTKRAPGNYFGVDFALVNIPKKVVSGAIDGVASQFMAFPLPTLSFEMSGKEMQENFSVTYINSNPTDQIKVSYLTASFGVSFPIDTKRN